ncbi:MAG: iron chelate uptake ABC transporter family permease subunit [Celeribacter sp.]
MTRPFIIAVIVLTCLSVLSLLIGASRLDGNALHLLTISRAPRTLAALLCGAAMAVAGVIMQQLVRNRFVEPSTTGTTEGAMLGLLIITLIAPGAPVIVKMSAAALAALGGVAGFLALIHRLSPRDPFMVPLIGLIWSGILGAGATWFAWHADLVQYLGNWMTGDFSGVLAGRYELLWLAGGIAALAYISADALTVTGLGAARARALGLDHRRAMQLGLGAVALVTALVVVTVGAVPFVGLVVPNLVSRLMGDNLRRTLPVVALGGAALVLGADIVGRLIRWPYEIPVGTVVGVAGAAIFLWILNTRGGHSHAG